MRRRPVRTAKREHELKLARLASRFLQQNAEKQDIDFRQRYGTKEQPEVAAFLGYEEEK